jgi:hypothetical protein
MALKIPSNPEEFADDFLRDIELGAIGIGVSTPPVQVGTDWWIMSRGIGQMAFQVAAAVNQADADGSVLTATGQALKDIRDADGLEAITGSTATGKIVLRVSGVRSVMDGEPGKIGSIRYTVVGNWIGVTDEDEITVVSVDKGTAANAEPPAVFKFDSAPLGIQANATVSTLEPIRGGLDAENDESMRARILDRRRNTPAGGNVGHIREIAFAAVGSLQEVYCYPALGGPGSVKVVPVKAIEPDNNDFSRILSTSALSLVRNKVQAELPMPAGVWVEAVAEQSVDVSILLDIPDSALVGGSGAGWVDADPWPVIGTLTYAAVTTVTASDDITITTGSATAPVAGLTSICWWAPGDQKFRTYLVTSITTAGGGPTYTHRVTVDRPMVDSDNNPVATGDYISPAAVNAEKYGNTWRDLMGTLGPGENTSDANRLPFALRRPLMSEGPQSELNRRLLSQLNSAHDEIANTDWSYRSATTPTVPGSVLSPPNVLTLDNFGIYEL